MRLLSRALGLSALLALPSLAAAATAAAVLGPPAPALPYHLEREAGHDPLRAVDWSARNGGSARHSAGRRGSRDRNHDHGRQPWNGPPGSDAPRRGASGWAPHGWVSPLPGARSAYGIVRPHPAPPLPVRVIENRLRHPWFRRVGRAVLRRGVYLVPALDPWRRRFPLAVDPATEVVLGRRRRPQDA